MTILINENSAGNGITGTLITDRAGPSQRVRVDSGQTSFFAGREFRTFLELNIAAASSITIRWTIPVNIIVHGLEFSAETGILEYRSYGNGTPGGTFSTALPIIPANSTTEVPTPTYVAQVTIHTGGTISGASPSYDVLRLKTNNNTNQASTVGGHLDDVRGYPPGTYYATISNVSPTDALIGMWKFRWEERVP